MNNYEIKFKGENVLTEHLRNTCRSTLEKISDLSPSDNDVRLVIERQGEEFIATIKMCSQSLIFNCKKAATTPFLALDTAAKLAIQQIRKWSSTRNFKDEE